MAKDRLGNELAIGDEILVLATVKTIGAGEQDGFISAVTAVPMPDDGRVFALPVLHGSQVEKKAG